jgi:hypothetical protein
LEKISDLLKDCQQTAPESQFDDMNTFREDINDFVPPTIIENQPEIAGEMYEQKL